MGRARAGRRSKGRDSAASSSKKSAPYLVLPAFGAGFGSGFGFGAGRETPMLNKT
jgi:hypothetical protein